MSQKNCARPKLNKSLCPFLLARQSHQAPRSVTVPVLLLVGNIRVHFLYLNPKIYKYQIFSTDILSPYRLGTFDGIIKKNMPGKLFFYHHPVPLYFTYVLCSRLHCNISLIEDLVRIMAQKHKPTMASAASPRAANPKMGNHQLVWRMRLPPMHARRMGTSNVPMR